MQLRIYLQTLLVKGMDSAFRESNTVLESILANTNVDIKTKLERI